RLRRQRDGGPDFGLRSRRTLCWYWWHRTGGAAAIFRVSVGYHLRALGPRSGRPGWHQSSWRPREYVRNPLWSLCHLSHPAAADCRWRAVKSYPVCLRHRSCRWRTRQCDPVVSAAERKSPVTTTSTVVNARLDAPVVPSRWTKFRFFVLRLPILQLSVL